MICDITENGMRLDKNKNQGTTDKFLISMKTNINRFDFESEWNFNSYHIHIGG